MAGGKSFLFLGPELGEKLDALDIIRKNLRGEDPPRAQSPVPPALEETSFYAGETPVSQIVSVIKNGSLFSDARLFIIKNAESIKKKEDAVLMVSCLENPGDGVTLILLSDETRLDKRIEDAVPRERRRIFWELFENRKSEWVASFFRRSGCRIDEGGIAAVLEMVENNTDALRRECTLLVFFLGGEKIISAEDVERCLSHTREESPFTLFAALARGNLSLSLDIERALLGTKQSPQAILAGLAWCFRKLSDYFALKETGEANDFEMKKIGLGSQKVRADYIEAARRWKNAGKALAVIGEYEYLFRSFGGDFEEILMDTFIYTLAAPR
ncbi:MAG: DNA polymerase III subunit delta [Treponema sp.]|jgi:DNA polymerase-3 subunit delta|nr:DNA polymerase III subunit delta [Treponema sp.]